MVMDARKVAGIGYRALMKSIHVIVVPKLFITIMKVRFSFV